MAVRILIADDHPAMRSAIAELIRLSEQDWEVCGEAENGQDVVEKVGKLKPDLIIMDLMMPERDGISASRAIREMLPEPAIVIYSLWVSPFLEREAKEAGIQAVVQKPNGAGLLAAIRDAIAVRGFRAGGGSPSRGAIPV